VQEIALDRRLSGEVIVTLMPETCGAELEIDGFALVPTRRLYRLAFEPVVWRHAPQRLPAPQEETLLLQYANVHGVYGLGWGAREGSIPFHVREFLCDDLDATLKLYVHDHVHDTLIGPGEGHFTNVFQRPVFLAPESERVVVGLLCYGAADVVRERLAAFDPADPAWAAAHAAAVERTLALEANPSGARYRFSQQRMAATVLTNVVYPVRTRGTWIKHYTPGRWWDSLYTWDSGFVGLGLAELDLERALDNLNTYLTEPGTEDAAFIHHGSPVPTQFYLFLAL
jgi:hypothetical protein